MSFSVVSIGDIVADLVFTIPHLPVVAEQHQKAHSVTIEPGGAGNFLIAGARLGMAMDALGAVGDDALGVSVRGILAAEGVAEDAVVVQPGAMTLPVLVLVDDAGEHVFIGGPRHAPPIVLPASWVERVQHADALFCNGFTLLETDLAPAALDLMQAAVAAHVPFFFDPGPFFASAQEIDRERALSYATAILLTESEIPAVTGGDPEIAALRSRLTGATQLICIKRGDRGCVVLTPSATIEHPGFPVPLVDSTGAGDCFAAAFVYGYLQRWPLPTMAAFANAMGAATVQKLGSGRQVPTRAEVSTVLRKFAVPMEFEP